MSNERKFQDHEIRQILDLAIGQEDGDAATPALPAVDGLTLRELQDVGREVGVSAEHIARAVAVFESQGEVVPQNKILGLPSSVGRVIPLSRNLSDREWELLVAELRTTFGVKGEMTSYGGFREWSHSNLHALIEPTETGYRLRLTDSNGGVAGILFGGFFMTFALMIAIVLYGKNSPGFAFAFPAFIALIGGGLTTASIRWLPKWAREQNRRMEHIAKRTASLLALPAPKDE